MGTSSTSAPAWFEKKRGQKKKKKGKKKNREEVREGETSLSTEGEAKPYHRRVQAEQAKARWVWAGLGRARLIRRA